MASHSVTWFLCMSAAVLVVLNGGDAKPAKKDSPGESAFNKVTPNKNDDKEMCDLLCR